MGPFPRCPGRGQRGTHDGLSSLQRKTMEAALLLFVEEVQVLQSLQGSSTLIFLKKKLLFSHVKRGLKPHLCVYGLP